MARWATSFSGSFPASAWAWPVSAPPMRGAAKGSSNTRHQLEPTMSTTPKLGRLAGRALQAILRTNFPAGQVPPVGRRELAGRADLLDGRCGKLRILAQADWRKRWQERSKRGS